MSRRIEAFRLISAANIAGGMILGACAPDSKAYGKPGETSPEVLVPAFDHEGFMQSAEEAERATFAGIKVNLEGGPLFMNTPSGEQYAVFNSLFTPYNQTTGEPEPSFRFQVAKVEDGRVSWIRMLTFDPENAVVDGHYQWWGLYGTGGGRLTLDSQPLLRIRPYDDLFDRETIYVRTQHGGWEELLGPGGDLDKAHEIFAATLATPVIPLPAETGRLP